MSDEKKVVWGKPIGKCTCGVEIYQGMTHHCPTFVMTNASTPPQPYWNYDAKPCQCCGQIHDRAELRTAPDGKALLERAASFNGHDWHGFTPDGDAHFCAECRQLAAFIGEQVEAALAAERPSNHIGVQRAVTGED